MIINGKPSDHSGQGRFWGNLLMTAVCMVLFCACLYAMSWWELSAAWVPGLIAMGLAVLTFIIPKELLGRSDSVDQEAIHTQAVETRAARH